MLKGDAEMIDSRTQYIVYQQREKELMAQIERQRARRENGQIHAGTPSWLAAAGQWVKAKVSASENTVAGAFASIHHSAA